MGALLRLALVTAAIWLPTASHAGIFDSILQALGMGAEETLDQNTVASGLKEALKVSATQAVRQVSASDGYLGNALIKITVPSKLQKGAGVLRKAGFGSTVDEFERTMNRAAEKAAPQAKDIFLEAIKGLSFADAIKILKGGETAATDYLRDQSSEKLYGLFKPVVSRCTEDVGVTRAYKEMTGKYAALVPFLNQKDLDLDHYVTSKGLEGLFTIVAQEERKIRVDPSGRATDLLKKVFGGI